MFESRIAQVFGESFIPQKIIVSIKIERRFFFFRMEYDIGAAIIWIRFFFLIFDCFYKKVQQKKTSQHWRKLTKKFL